MTKAFKNANKFAASVCQHFYQYKLIHKRTIHNKWAKWAYQKHKIVYSVELSMKQLNMYKWNVRISGTYEKQLETGSDVITVATLIYQTLKKSLMKTVTAR